MGDQLKRIPSTGSKKPVFFNGWYVTALNEAIRDQIPGKMTVITGRENMEKELAKHGMDAKVPAKVPYDPWEKEITTDRVAMAITDLDEKALLEAICSIGSGASGEYRSREERSMVNDTLREAETENDD